MANKKKQCPYATREDLEAAIKKHRGIERLAIQIDTAPNVIRRWCHEMGALTRSGASPGSPRKECPYATVEELRLAIDEHGSLNGVAAHHDVTWSLAKRWAREFGVDTSNVKKPTEVGQMIEGMSDAELEAFIHAFGWERTAELCGISRRTLTTEAKRRGVEITRITSPKTAMLNRRVKELERESQAINELRASIVEAAEVVRVEAPPKLPRIKVRKDRSEVDVILHVSDKQYGMLVDPAEVPGGFYDPTQYEERLGRYLTAVDALLENTAAANPIGTVWIAQGGDFVEGEDVFKGQSAWHLAMDAGEQVVRLSRIWAAALARISARARQVGATQVAVVSVVGNHGQHGGRSAGATPPSLNYDFLTYEMIRAQLDDGTVDYYDEEARRAVYFETCGGIVLLTHGEQDKGGGLIGVPVVTGMRNSLTAMVSTGVRPVLQLSGHFHRPAQISLSSDLMRIWSGPWVGQTNLSIGRGGASSPSQHMLVMHPEHGMIAQHVIRLTPAVESSVEIVRL